MHNYHLPLISFYFNLLYTKHNEQYSKKQIILKLNNNNCNNIINIVIKFRKAQQFHRIF